MATVGTGRDRSDIAGAIAFAVNYHKADRAVFLCSRKTHEETLPRVVARLGWADDRYCAHICTDEDNVQSLFLEWLEAWPGLVGSGPGGQAIVDFTSGTKPMSAAAFALGVARGCAAVSYTTGERDETGRVVESRDCVSFSPDLVVAHRQLELAAELFNLGQYAAAREIAGRFRSLSNEYLRRVAESLWWLGGAYDCWDRFDWKGAASALHQSKRSWGDWPWVESDDQLCKNESLIKEAKRAKGRDLPNATMLADLLANAERCLAQGYCDDAVCRLYRGFEMLAQYVLAAEEYRQRTDNINIDDLPKDIRPKYQEKAQKAPDGRLRLGLAGAYELLEDLGDPLGKDFRKLYGKWPKWGKLHDALERRNGSLLAHGLNPIDHQTAEYLQEVLVELARPRMADLDELMASARPVRIGRF